MKKSFIILLGTLFLTTAMAEAQTYQSLYSDHKARQTGDLLTVLIVEFTTAE
ncbi:MAG: flagellar basal body L-ring protein FlgH, partial [Gammaproteobacteria bacterium]|nr:flagellar basal body L-ring protein FlgH [Gammaproteobacteria bacterium]NIR93572.1 flagellar basal body L-ring protein FlgH [Gammaproteobacteria bacterium]